MGAAPARPRQPAVRTPRRRAVPPAVPSDARRALPPDQRPVRSVHEATDRPPSPTPRPDTLDPVALTEPSARVEAPGVSPLLWRLGFCGLALLGGALASAFLMGPRAEPAAAALPRATHGTAAVLDPAPPLLPAPVLETEPVTVTIPVAPAAAASAVVAPAARAEVPSRRPALRPRPPVVEPPASAAPAPRRASARAVPAMPPELAEIPAQPAMELPETPSRGDVQMALSALQPALLNCANGRGGLAGVTVNVAPTGRVRTAHVNDGDFVGTPQGSCMARALRSARFPAFAADGFSVDYPFSL